LLLVELDSWHILDANEQARDLFGRENARLTTLSLEDLIDQADFRDLLSTLRASSDRRALLPTIIRRADGPTLHATLGVSVDDLGTRPVGIVTLRVLPEASAARTNAPAALSRVGDPLEDSQRELRDHEVRFRTLVDSVPAGIFFTDADGRLMYVNERWSKIAGLSRNEAFQHGWLDRIHEDDRERVAIAWKTFVTSPSKFEIEFRFMYAEGESRWVSGNAVSFRREDGHRIGFLGMLMDIDSRKRAEQKLSASEEKYRTIFENIVDVYYETTLEGEILEVSPSIANYGGLTREELIGKSMLSFYADGAQRMEMLEAMSEKGAITDYEIELGGKDGRTRTFSITSKLEHDAAGKSAKIIGTMRDISSRKFAYDLLDAERQNLELIAKDVPLPEILDSIVRTIESRRNGLICSILLLGEEGKHLRLGAAPSLHKDYSAAIDGIEIGPASASCGTAAFTRELVVVSDIATDPLWDAYRDLALSHNLRACWSQPILSSTGAVLGTLAMYYEKPRKPRDLDLQLIQGATHLAAIAIERVKIQAEQKNLEAQMRQAQKLESLGVLAGGIAHDFNNLLTGIMGYASLAMHSLKEENSPTLRQVTEIRDISVRAAELIKQMLAYSGKGKFVIVSLNLSQVVEELSHLLRVSVSKKARLLYDFDDDLPSIEADSAQVQQVVMNLITNASEALGEESGDISIRTGVQTATAEYLADSCLDTHLPAGRYVFVEVADTGCGMDEETRSKIFEPFYTTKFTGRGLGMSAALGIMRGHGGTIKIATITGEGTTIRLLFPCAEPRARSLPESAPKQMEAQTDYAKEEGVVLVVDDEELIRDMAGEILTAAGYTVTTAVDGQDFFDVYDRLDEKVVAVLLDLTMPRMNGAEVLRELRARGDETPILLSSGYTVEDVTKRLDGERFEGFLQKPYPRTSLVEKIRKVAATPVP